MVSHGLTVSPAPISVTPSARKTRMPVVTKLPRHMGGSMCAHAAGPTASTSSPATANLADTFCVIFIGLSLWLFNFSVLPVFSLPSGMLPHALIALANNDYDAGGLRTVPTFGARPSLGPIATAVVGLVS